MTRRFFILRTVHFSDNQPFIYEERYTSLDAVPDFAVADLEKVTGERMACSECALFGGRCELLCRFG